jgi:hypothetical protein
MLRLIGSIAGRSAACCARRWQRMLLVSPLILGALANAGCQNMNNTESGALGGGVLGGAFGAVLGGILGGGKGAAIGAGAGGGVGAGDVLLTRGKPAVLPSETRITFRLDQPVTITEKRS